MTAFTSEAISAVNRLTLKLATTRGFVMTSIILLRSIFAVKTTSEASGISTTRLKRLSVTPIDKPNPGIILTFFFITNRSLLLIDTVENAAVSEVLFVSCVPASEVVNGYEVKAEVEDIAEFCEYLFVRGTVEILSCDTLSFF